MTGSDPFGRSFDGALLVHKHSGVSSFGILEALQKGLREKHGLKRKELPKMGHGGTLDPFATGLLVVLVGRGVKLARYFLGSKKEYTGVIRFGETSVSGDLTGEISEVATQVPANLDCIQKEANWFTQSPYSQIPPMHSAKKKNGKPLYELARAGVEIEREPKICQISKFQIQEYSSPRASFAVECSSGTYVRVLAQDLAIRLGSLALLEKLHRTRSGIFSVEKAWSVADIHASQENWHELPCWVPFDQLLNGYPKAEASSSEKLALLHGKQEILGDILSRVPAQVEQEQYPDCVAIYSEQALVAIARLDRSGWGIERVIT